MSGFDKKTMQQTIAQENPYLYRYSEQNKLEFFSLLPIWSEAEKAVQEIDPAIESQTLRFINVVAEFKKRIENKKIKKVSESPTDKAIKLVLQGSSPKQAIKEVLRD